MKSTKISTEDIILKAAEEEFLQNGYGNAKMLSIAKRAGVSHSMLHYYFRTKENLFQMIFHRKSEIIGNHIRGILEQNSSFKETVAQIIRLQFEFVLENPNLPRFILNEVIANENNRETLINIIRPKLLPVYSKIAEMLNNEIKSGHIRQISVLDFFMNIVAVNVSIFLVIPILPKLTDDQTSIDEILRARCESNVQFILNGLLIK